MSEISKASEENREMLANVWDLKDSCPRM